jgi:hypothetical protein
MISGLFRCPPINSSRYGAISAAAFLLFRVFPAPSPGQIVLTEGESFKLRFSLIFFRFFGKLIVPHKTV